MNIKNIFKHLHMIHIHRKYVRKYTAMCGILRLGIKHDLSKYHPEEFFESVKYYTGTCSPIEECRKINGFSYARLHHKGRNKHHFEYWIDETDEGSVAIKMPYKYAVEMICDMLAAGKTYRGDSFSVKDERKWWSNKLSTNPKIHLQTKIFVTRVLDGLVDFNNELEVLNPNTLKDYYIWAEECYELFKNKEV